MQMAEGFDVVRFGDALWERRVEDDWPPLVKRLHVDTALDLAMNVVWYQRGAVEPRHVHPGTHATWVLLGAATMDGRTIGPGDLVYGPGGVPHGPLHYEMGCMLFSSIHGGTHHRVAEEGDEVPAEAGPRPGLVALDGHDERPSDVGTGNTRTVMVEDRTRDYTAWMSRWPAGGQLASHTHAGAHAALLLSGRALVGQFDLRPWDLLYAPPGRRHQAVRFPEPTSLLMIGIGDVTPSREG